MRYRSKPHTIEGFKLEHGCVAPDWFKDAVTIGHAMVVNNEKQFHVSIYNGEGDCRVAYKDDYICMNKSGTIFPLTQEEFDRGFEVDV